MKDKQQINGLCRNRIDLIGLCRHREQHLQEVLGVVEIIARIHERLADIELVGGRRDSRQLGQDPVRKNIAMLRIGRIHHVVVVRRHRADHGRKHGHRMGVVTEPLEEVQHALVEHGVRSDRVIELFELLGGGQLAV